MRILFIAPAAQLQTQTELVRAAQRQTPTFCDGYVDRAKLEEYLKQQYDAIHFAGHGGLSILELSDGPLEVSELLGMLQGQQALRFVVITACHSARVGTEIHNALHVPVVMMQADIGDQAAVRFAETFYRNYRATADLGRAVDTGRAALSKAFPGDGDVVTLINGDMATDSELAGCMDFVRGEITALRLQINGIEADVKDMKAQQPRLTLVSIGLLALLLLAQIATPWLTALARP